MTNGKIVAIILLSDGYTEVIAALPGGHNMSTDAQMHRNQHIAKVKAQIARLTNAVNEFEQYTAEMPDWEYVGDWASLAQDVIDATDRAESMARQTNKWWKVTK